eukprot:4894119-Prymnesium_polylepis.1
MDDRMEYAAVAKVRAGTRAVPSVGMSVVVVAMGAEEPEGVATAEVAAAEAARAEERQEMVVPAASQQEVMAV